jgi:hypothetical protein
VKFGYLRVDICDALAFLAVEAEIDFWVAEEFPTNEGVVVGSALVSSGSLLLDFHEVVLLFET